MQDIFSFDNTFNDYLEEHDSIKKTDNNCLTKDEFIVNYTKELKDI